MKLDPLKLSQELIKYNSVSGIESGVIDFLDKKLSKIGFKCDLVKFDGDGSYGVKNLHALYNPNNSPKTFYFAGHTDVVPVGDETAWKHPPFEGVVVDDILYGRGVVDMKCAIAAFFCAAEEFIKEFPDTEFGIGFLITDDEEADAINGTKKMLEWMKQNNKKMSACLIGEPTNPTKLGEEIKIGRRGSISFSLKVIGVQGHVAYPHNANNPITILINTLKFLKDHKLDNGNIFFDPSNLEITNIASSSAGSNVIPAYATANFNIRFNNEHNSESIIAWVKYACRMAGKFELSHRVSGEPFITEPGFLSDIVVLAIKEEIGFEPKISTSGGTSDARFIKDFCPVIEFGLINKTAHHVNENIAIEDIYKLKEIYKKILIFYGKK